jgi:hypothetical protein
MARQYHAWYRHESRRLPRANALYVDIEHAAIAFGVLILDADEGKIGTVNRAWANARDAMTKAASACAS